MTRASLLLLLVGLLLQPVAPLPRAYAQEDDETEIEIGDGSAPSGAEDPAERKRVGPDGDIGAPKVKLPLQVRINEAIKRGVEWLKKKQIVEDKKHGHWGPCTSNRKYSGETGNFTTYHSGPTSFAMYTLAKCGVDKNDKVIKRGYTWLRREYRKSQIWNGASQSPPNRSMVSYEVSSLLLMLEATFERSGKLTKKKTRKTKKAKKKRRLHTDNPNQRPDRSRIPKDDWKWLNEAVIFLTEGRPGGGGGRSRRYKGMQNPGAGWRYGQYNGDQDVSATQFALLGLRAASDAGYPVKPEIWLGALKYLRSMQVADGSFGYRKGDAWNAGMTAAGTASALICRERLALLGDPEYPVPSWTDEMIKRGMARVDQVFDATKNSGTHHGGSYHYYYLYSIERVGDLTGRSEFNGKNWYVRGAEFLLSNQAPDGSWTDSSCMAPRDTLGTCFALLFLKRATVPTVTVSGN